MERIQYILDEEEPSLTGWWILSFDVEEGVISEYNYDALGPFDTHAQALMAQLNTSEPFEEG